MSFQDFKYGGKGSSSEKSWSQGVAGGIFQINTAVAGFRRLVNAIGTSKDSPDHRQKLHNTRQRISQLVKETSAKLKSLGESHHSANVDPSKRIEAAKLAREFQSTLQEFQKVQQLASERESTYSPSAPAPKNSSSGESSAPEMERESQPFLMQQKRQEISYLGNEIAFNEAIIDERELGITDIQDQIGEANEIFKDLAVLVHDQGVVIDDVHSNIEVSVGATTRGRVQLAKASKGAKSKSSWCWWLLAIIFVVVLVVVLLVFIL